MSVGGMYEALSLLLGEVLSSLKGAEFTSKQLAELSGLCERSAQANISRLVRAGLLIRIETRTKGLPGRSVKYKFSEEVLVHVKDNLY